jgi:hypothetical protein
MEQRVMAELAAEGHEMTIAHARVFQRIAPGGSRLTELADPTDGRARLVVVAERGARAVERSARTVAAVEQEWAAHLGAQRYAQLRAILTDLREITDPWRD